MDGHRLRSINSITKTVFINNKARIDIEKIKKALSVS